MKRKGNCGAISLKCFKCRRKTGYEHASEAASGLSITGRRRPLTPSEFRLRHGTGSDRHFKYEVEHTCGHRFWTKHAQARWMYERLKPE